MPSKKYIVFGDIHGDFLRWHDFILDLSKEIKFDGIIQCGDFGWWFDCIQKYKTQLTNIFNSYPVYFVRGNHCEYTRYDRPYFSEFKKMIVDIEFPNVKYEPIELGRKTINKISIQGIGGADSVDKNWRVEQEKYETEGIRFWWPEEAVDLSKAKMSQFDIIISHDIPDNVTQYMKMLSNDKIGNEALTAYYCKYPPKFWFAGHHHHYENFIDDRSGTEFFVMPECCDGFAIIDFCKDSEIKVEAYNVW